MATFALTMIFLMLGVAALAATPWRAIDAPLATQWPFLVGVVFLGFAIWGVCDMVADRPLRKEVTWCIFPA